MSNLTPIFAAEPTAAKLLDMKPHEFRELVDKGVLPPPRDLDGLKRWDVQELRRIISGEAADGMGDVKW